MTLEDEKYYETFFELFASAGWKQFVEEIDKSKTDLTLEKADTLESLFHFKGQKLILDNISNYENLIKNSFDSIKESEEEEEYDA